MTSRVKFPKTRKEAFEVLGLNNNPSKEEIKKAYKKLAKLHHPDKHSNESEEKQNQATENFKAISTACEILINQNITEEYLSKQDNGDWVDEFMYKYNSWSYDAEEQFDEALSEEDAFGSHLTTQENNLFANLLGQNLKAVKPLLLKIERLNIKTNSGDKDIQYGILHYLVKNACEKSEEGWEGLIQEFLSLKNVDINIGDKGGNTPIHIASQYSRTDLINILHKYKADINKLNTLGYSPLFEAAYNKNVEAVKFFLKHGSKIDNGQDDILVNYVLFRVAHNQFTSEVIQEILRYVSVDEKNKITSEYEKTGKNNIVGEYLKQLNNVQPNCNIRANNKHNFTDISNNTNVDDQQQPVSNNLQQDTVKKKLLETSTLCCIAAGIVAGALVFYFLAPLILGTGIGIGTQLGFVAVGAAIGTVMSVVLSDILTRVVETSVAKVDGIKDPCSASMGEKTEGQSSPSI